MAARVLAADAAPWLLQPPGWRSHLCSIGGLDMSFLASGSAAVAALAVLSFPGLHLTHLELLRLDALPAPYLPGFLAYRWVGLAPALLQGGLPDCLLAKPRRCCAAQWMPSKGWLAPEKHPACGCGRLMCCTPHAPPCLCHQGGARLSRAPAAGGGRGRHAPAAPGGRLRAPAPAPLRQRQPPGRALRCAHRCAAAGEAGPAAGLGLAQQAAATVLGSSRTPLQLPACLAARPRKAARDLCPLVQSGWPSTCCTCLRPSCRSGSCGRQPRQQPRRQQPRCQIAAQQACGAPLLLEGLTAGGRSKAVAAPIPARSGCR